MLAAAIYSRCTSRIAGPLRLHLQSPVARASHTVGPSCRSSFTACCASPLSSLLFSGGMATSFPSSVHAFHSRVLFLHSQRAYPDGKAAAATGGAPLAADGGAPLVPLPLVRWRSVERRLARWFARSVGTQKASRRSLSTMCSDSGVCTSRTSTPRYLKLTRRRTRACRSQ